jgi:hypothetical protein
MRLNPLLGVAKAGMDPGLTFSVKDDGVPAILTSADPKLADGLWRVIRDDAAAWDGRGAETQFDVLPISGWMFENNC